MKEDSTTEEILQRAVDLLKNDQSDLGISSVLTKGQHSSFVQSLLSNESHDHEATELPPSDSEQETTGTSDLDVASQLESLLHRRNQEEPKEKESEAELDLSKELDVLAQRRTTTLSPELVARLVAGAEEEPEHSPIEDPPIKLEGRLDFQISSQTSSPEVLPLENEEVAGSEKGSFEKLAKEKQWNELTEHAAQLMQREDGSALEARIWWIRGQFEERSVPLSILAAPLHGAIESLLLSSEDHPQIEQEAKALCLSLSKKLHKAGEYVLSLSLAERAIDLCTRSLETTSQKEKLETLSQATTEEHQRVYKHFHRTATDVIASLSSVPEYKRTESQGEELKRLQALLDGIAPRGPEKKSQAVVMDIPEVLPTHMPGKAQTDSWSQYRSLFLLLLGIVCGGAVWRAGVIQDAYAWITAIPQGSIETVLQIEAPSLSSPEARRRLTDKLDAIESLLQKVDYVPSPVVHNQTSSNQDSPFREPRRGSTLDKIVLSGPIEPKDFPQSEIGEASTEGNAARYPIERFSTPKVYEIIARTQILKDPSYTAEVVGTLHVGHRVEANAQYGPWLRLRSKSGRDGFILVQDSKDTGS